MIETSILAGTSARPTESKPFSCEDGDSRANQAVSPFSVALEAATPSRARPDGLASAHTTARNAQQDTLKSTGRNTPGESSIHVNARQHPVAMRYAANDRARADKPDAKLTSPSMVSVNEEKEEARSVNAIPDTSPPAQTLLEPAVFPSAPPPTPDDLSTPQVPADNSPGNQPANRESLTLGNQAQRSLPVSSPMIDQNHGEAGHATHKATGRAGTAVDHGKDDKPGENSALYPGVRSTSVAESKKTGAQHRSRPRSPTPQRSRERHPGP